MTTFITTAPRRVGAAKLAQLTRLIRENPRFWISTGTPEHGQPAHTLYYDGARENAPDDVIKEFLHIADPGWRARQSSAVDHVSITWDSQGRRLINGTLAPEHRGQGRKPIDAGGELMRSRAVRMTDAQWGKCKRLGGAKFLRDKIEQAKE